MPDRIIIPEAEVLVAIAGLAEMADIVLLGDLFTPQHQALEAEVLVGISD